MRTVHNRHYSIIIPSALGCVLAHHIDHLEMPRQDRLVVLENLSHVIRQSRFLLQIIECVSMPQQHTSGHGM